MVYKLPLSPAEPASPSHKITKWQGRNDLREFQALTPHFTNRETETNRGDQQQHVGNVRETLVGITTISPLIPLGQAQPLMVGLTQ